MSLAGLLAAVARALRGADIPFMLTGSLAAAYYGTPRATQDIDLVVETSGERLDRLVDALSDAGFYVSRDAAQGALAGGGQFNAIDPSNGWKVDFMIRRSRPFSETEFGRRRRTELFGVEVALATVEDLIISKLEWSELGDSELQRRDVAELVAAMGDALDVDYMEKWIHDLGLESAWQRIRSSSNE
ncbi:MAG TPA: hypothetical protein VMN78_03505 [Longimicrobiales bacterium]|nr:hypothetical protein [Longimicrobiales bacterium]